MDLRALAILSLLAREVQWSTGTLLTGARRDGSEALLDAETGGEVKNDAGPTFVLSTEGGATDGHIVRQLWDLSRAQDTGPGAPVLWNHTASAIVGQWRDLGVRSLESGPALVGRIAWNAAEPMTPQRRAEVASGMLRSTSVGWIPGDLVRRGSLPEDDPNFLPMEDDECGRATEGFVMGTKERPNILVEASLTPIPADQRAVLLARSRGALHSLDTLTRGDRVPARDVDLGAILLALRGAPVVRTWARALVLDLAASDEEVRAAVRSILGVPPSSSGPTLADLFGA